MDRGRLEEVKREVVRRYPELSGVEPKISPGAEGLTLLTFRAQVETPEGVRLALVVHATVDGQGRLLKLSASKG